MKCLAGMTLAEQVEHLTYMVEELTTPPPEHTDDLQFLTPSQRGIVGLLLRREGRTVVHSALIAAGDIGLDADARQTLQSQICLIRGRLRKAGVPIEIHTTWGIGYRAVRV